MTMEIAPLTTPVIYFTPSDFEFLATPWRMENASDIQVAALMDLGLAPYSPLSES